MAVETAIPLNSYTRADWTDFQHTGPGTLAGRFMRMFWQPVQRSQDLPGGRAVPMMIMNEAFTLYRGESGAAHAVAFRCAHRGTQLSTGWVDGDWIRCRYHGWTYDGDGQCVEQPVETEPFANKVKIRSYPVQEYLGLIFVYMGEDDPPPALPHYDEFDDPNRFIEVVPPKVCESNYFRRVEHIGDEGHTIFAHHWRPASKMALPRMEARETDWGVVHIAERPNGTKMNQYLVPNMMYSRQDFDPPEEGPRLRIMWKVPVDDDHYWNLGVLLLALRGEAAAQYRKSQEEREAAVTAADTPAMLQRILAGEITLEEVRDRTDISHLEDEVILVGMPLADAGPFPDQLGSTDAFVVVKRKIWERELRAIAEGGPLKEWKWAGTAPTTIRDGSDR